MSWPKFAFVVGCLIALIAVVTWSLPGVYAAFESGNWTAIVSEVLFAGLVCAFLMYLVVRVGFMTAPEMDSPDDPSAGGRDQ